MPLPDQLLLLLLRGLVGAMLIMSLQSCTGKTLRTRTDREIFSIIKKSKVGIPNVGVHLESIIPPAPVTLEKLEKNVKTEDFLGDRKNIEQNARVISLPKALDLAVHHNRTYLGEKERVYLAALDLALTRYNYSPIAAAASSLQQTSQQVQVPLRAPSEQSVSTATVAPVVNQLITQNTLQARGNVGFTMLAQAGTQIAADLATDFTRFLTGGLRNVSDSRLAASVTQPLLRGAGRLGAREPLTQAERNCLYSIRSFTQYRKNFAVDVARAYYEALLSRESARNAHIAYIAFAGAKGLIERETAMAAANKRTLSSLGQLRQAELTYQRRWIQAIQNYEQNLDDLKIELGVPVTDKIILDQNDFTKLSIMHLPGVREQGIETALQARLDLHNERDSLIDAERKIKVAEQNLLPGLNIGLDFSITGNANSTKPSLNARNNSVGPRIEFDPNLDRRSERVDLRATEVSAQRSKRALELAEEQVRKQVRASWRDLELAKKQYEIAQTDLKISQQRLTMEEEFMAVDKGTARDLIEAQRDLIDARDFNNTALVAHTLARISLYRDMGVLFIRNDGSWEDVLNQEQPLARP
jgi:outer membrane protein TolC